MEKASKTKTAKTYAAALYDAAIETKSVKSVFEDVLKLRSLFAKEDDLRCYLKSPLWSETDKADVLKKAAKVLKLNAKTLSCLELVVQNRRVSALESVLEEFEHLYYQKNKIAEVDVETVKNLTAAQDKTLKNVLKKMLAQEVVIRYHLNPDLLGGLRIQCGSKMFDDSLSAKLNYLENLMKGK